MKLIRRFFAVCFPFLFSITAYSSIAYWSSGTAHLLPKGRWEIGLFQPLRYAHSEKMEWSTHPVFDLLIPNISVKVGHSQYRGWTTATRHSLVYPTFLLRIIQKEGTGGIIAPDPDISEIPHIISLRNEILLTKPLSVPLLLTGKAGVTFAFGTSDLDERTTIDLPVVFPRMGAYYRKLSFNTGLDLNGSLSESLGFLGDVDIFFIPGWSENFFFEHKGMILWNRSDRFQVAVGYKLSYGKYPFGNQWHLLPPKIPRVPVWLPFIDFQWAGGKSD